MRLEVVCALLAVALVTIGTSAEDSDRPWRSYVDDEQSVRDALDDDDGRSVRDALDSSRPWRSYVDDERSVRDALDSSRPWRSYVDDERSVRDAVDDESVLGNDDGRSVRDDDANNCKLCRRFCRLPRPPKHCRHCCKVSKHTCTCAWFSISVRHAITDVGLFYLATVLNTIVTFCQTASIMYCCAYTFQLFFARTAREVYETNRENSVVHA